MPGSCGDLDGMDRTCCGKNDPLADPAGVVEGQIHGRAAQHQEYLPGQRVGMAVRSYVGTWLDGHTETLDRVFEHGMEIMMCPLPW